MNAIPSPLKAGLVALACVVLATSAGCGLFSVRVGGKTYNSNTANSTLESIARDVESARSKLPDRYGNDPAGELEKIKKVEKAVAKAQGRMTASLRMGTDYDKVQTQIHLLRSDVGVAKLQQACSAARGHILANNEVGELASEADIDAFDQAVQALVAKVGEEDQTGVWWREEMIRLVREQPAVAERAEEIKRQAQRKAEEEAAREAAKKAKEARRELEQRIKAVRDAAIAIMRELDDHMKANEAPIPEARLAEFRAAYARVAEIHAPDQGVYETRLHLYRTYNAWFADDGPAAVAGALGGELVSGGETKGTEMKVRFKAEAGWCYTMAVRWKIATGGEKINDFAWSAKGGNTPLQRYSLHQQRVPWPWTRGTCVTKATTITAAATLEFAGTRNGLRYAIVGWAKPDFPLQQALYSTTWKGDVCNADHWAKLWTDPIPGSIVYHGKEPFLVTSTSRAGQLWLTLMDASGRDNTRARKTEITSKPPGQIAFRTQWSKPGCPGSSWAEGKDSIKLAKCRDGVEAKYIKLYDAAERARDNARTIGAYRAAIARLERLEDQEVTEYRKRCDPVENKIAKQLQATFNAIVDRYMEAPYSDHLDVSTRLVEEEDSF